MKTSRAPLIILTVGFSFSLAANMLWTWDGGIVRVLGGALASLALPGALHLWDQIPATERWTRALRAAVMTLIAGMAAYTTFSHASSLLVLHGEDPLLAALYPVMTELLVVMGVLARKAPPDSAATAGRRRASRAGLVDPRPGTPTLKPQPASTGTPLPPAAPAGPDGKLPPLVWAQLELSKTGQVPAAKTIETATGVTKGYSHRVRNKLLERQKALELVP